MSGNSKITLRDPRRLTLTQLACIALLVALVAICFHVNTIDVAPVFKWTVIGLLALVGLPMLVMAVRAPVMRITIKADGVVNAGWWRTVLLNRSDIVDVDTGPYKGRWGPMPWQTLPLNLVLLQGLRVRVDALVETTGYSSKVLELKVALDLA